ncbi:MAG: FecR domain-containing protein [Kiritimatiellae bacterium]|nr:FecR domain-containing protein [Kiritimatiellia bacterium]MDD5519875.1 FecR domain-containing protein [Kiritimatiellia bacterium]
MNENHEKMIAEFMSGEGSGRELLELCRKDKALLNELAELTVMERLLSHQAQDSSSELFAAEVRAILSRGEESDSFVFGVRDRLAKENQTLPVSRLFWLPNMLKLAAAALIVFSMSYWIYVNRPVAVLANSAAADWTDKTIGIEQVFKRGIVDLKAGCAELKFRNNVIVLLEGPARLRIKSADHVVLYQGNLVADVPKNAIGFRVDTPTSEVIDLGTVFGVSVDQKGVSEIHVIKGKVKARKNGNQSFVDLTENEARSFSRDENLARIIESNMDKFLRVLPGKSGRNPAYLHWSFDEGQGTEAGENHVGNNTTNYPARLKSLKEDGEIPEWNNGQFGNALYFNGSTAYAVTDYPGIGANHPRTVAFWVKVPKPDSMTPVYGLVSWGSMADIGSAWQISINPTEKEGPLGRLRMGTKQAQAIGTTDLRDNRWHHIAVVMYGGETADVSTHILLYIDGKLEKTSRKSIHRIFTDIESGLAVTVMFGRDMGHPLDDSKFSYNLFKGWLDEVYIFEAALSREQVESLMKNNRVPSG